MVESLHDDGVSVARYCVDDQRISTTLHCISLDAHSHRWAVWGVVSVVGLPLQVWSIGWHVDVTASKLASNSVTSTTGSVQFWVVALWVRQPVCHGKKNKGPISTKSLSLCPLIVSAYTHVFS